MSLNLISDPWIPVISDGMREVIRPDQIAEAAVERPDWPRADLNLACYEFLIGLVYLACPPRDITDWKARQVPDATALRAALAPLAPAFNLTGPGPLFLQDLEPLMGGANSPDMLFIDGAGGNATKKNADLMVHRARFTSLDLPMAAMALFTLQSQAPAGGAGNRTSMRGGGPMVTLVRPTAGPSPLWSTVWANVPEGRPLTTIEALPWMRPTVTSENGEEVHQPVGPLPAEAFFGMPRRLRLVTEDGVVTGVIQRPRGTNYGHWTHPLTPYYAITAGGERLPRHPRPGSFHYRNWLGIVLEAVGDAQETAFAARAVGTYRQRDRSGAANLLVAGWAMSNMSPLDFLWSEQPLFRLSSEAADFAGDLVAAADLAAGVMVGALKAALGVGADASRIEALREAFFLSTQRAFEAAIAALAQGEAVLAEGWRREIERVAVTNFDAEALPGLFEREVVSSEAAEFAGKPTVKTVVEARKRLMAGLRGKKMRDALGIEFEPAGG